MMNGDGCESLTQEWLSVKQSAAILGGVSSKLVYKLFHGGELAGAKIGGTVRIRAASVREYLHKHSNRKPEPTAGRQDKAPERAKGQRARKDGKDFTSYYLAELDRIERRHARRGSGS